MNPYAAPESDVAVSEVRLRDNEGYRIVDRVLYCREQLDLRDICWLTGATEGLVGSHRSVPRAAPKWVIQGFLMAISAVFAYQFILFSGGNSTQKWPLFYHPLLLSNWLLHYLLGKKVQVRVGQSAAAQSKMRAARIFHHSILFYVCALAVVVAVLSLTTEHAALWAVIIGVNLGVVAGLVYYIRNRPRGFTVRAAIHCDGVYRLRGLSPEFLHTAMQKHSL